MVALAGDRNRVGRVARRWRRRLARQTLEGGRLDGDDREPLESLPSPYGRLRSASLRSSSSASVMSVGWATSPLSSARKGEIVLQHS